MKVLVYGTHQFRELSQEYKVVSVPKIWVNDRIYIDGAAPTEEMMLLTFMAMIEQALDDSIPPGRFRIGRQ